MELHLNQTKYLSDLKRAVKLYATYLLLSIFVWILNSYFLGEIVSRAISNVSDNFAQESLVGISPIGFFLQSLAAVFIIYLLIILMQVMLKAELAKIMYIFLALIVGLASKGTFGGGLITYMWPSNLITILLGQLEWFGGAMIISSLRMKDETKYRFGLYGMALITASLLFITLCAR